MAAPERTFRTLAFRMKGNYDFRFWIMEPAYGKPGWQIKEHDKGVNSGATSRIEDGLTEEKALLRMAEIERDARAKYPVAPDAEHAQAGLVFTSAEYYADRHQAFVSETTLRTLRQRRGTSGLRLKPQ